LFDIASLTFSLAAAFLKGSPLPADCFPATRAGLDPLDLQSISKRLSDDQPFKRECQLCNRTLYGPAEWEQHMRSKQHRKALRSTNADEAEGLPKKALKLSSASPDEI